MIEAQPVAVFRFLAEAGSHRTLCKFKVEGAIVIKLSEHMLPDHQA